MEGLRELGPCGMSIRLLENTGMKKAIFLVVVTTLVLSLAAFAQTEKSASGQQVQPPAGQAQRPQNMTPEERAKLKEKWQNMTPEERAQFRAKTREQLGGARPGPEAGQQRRLLASELAAYKQQHQQLMGQLQSIRQLAVKEKATETTKALDKMIATREDEYQKRVKAMEQRLEKAQGAQKGTEGQKSEPNQPKSADKAATAPAKQSPKNNTAKPK